MLSAQCLITETCFQPVFLIITTDNTPEKSELNYDQQHVDAHVRNNGKPHVPTRSPSQMCHRIRDTVVLPVPNLGSLFNVPYFQNDERLRVLTRDNNTSTFLLRNIVD